MVWWLRAGSVVSIPKKLRAQAITTAKQIRDPRTLLTERQRQIVQRREEMDLDHRELKHLCCMCGAKGTEYKQTIDDDDSSTTSSEADDISEYSSSGQSSPTCSSMDLEEDFSLSYSSYATGLNIGGTGVDDDTDVQEDSQRSLSTTTTEDRPCATATHRCVQRPPPLAPVNAQHSPASSQPTSTRLCRPHSNSSVDPKSTTSSVSGSGSPGTVKRSLSFKGTALSSRSELESSITNVSFTSAQRQFSSGSFARSTTSRRSKSSRLNAKSPMLSAAAKKRLEQEKALSHIPKLGDNDLVLLPGSPPPRSGGGGPSNGLNPRTIKQQARQRAAVATFARQQDTTKLAGDKLREENEANPLVKFLGTSWFGSNGDTDDPAHLQMTQGEREREARRKARLEKIRKRRYIIRKDGGLKKIHDTEVDMYSSIFHRPIRGYLCDVCHKGVRQNIELLKGDIEKIIGNSAHKVVHTNAPKSASKMLQETFGTSPIRMGSRCFESESGYAASPTQEQQLQHQAAVQRARASMAAIVNNTVNVSLIDASVDSSTLDDHQQPAKAVRTVPLRECVATKVRNTVICAVCHRRKAGFFYEEGMSFLCSICVARDKGYRDGAVPVATNALVPAHDAVLIASLMGIPSNTSYRKRNHYTNIKNFKQPRTLFHGQGLDLFTHTSSQLAVGTQPRVGMIRVSEADFEGLEKKPVAGSGSSLPNAVAPSRSVLKSSLALPSSLKSSSSGTQNPTAPRRHVGFTTVSRDSARSTSRHLFSGRSIRQDDDLFSAIWAPQDVIDRLQHEHQQQEGVVGTFVSPTYQDHRVAEGRLSIVFPSQPPPGAPKESALQGTLMPTALDSSYCNDGEEPESVANASEDCVSCKANSTSDEEEEEEEEEEEVDLTSTSSVCSSLADIDDTSINPPPLTTAATTTSSNASKTPSLPASPLGQNSDDPHLAVDDEASLSAQ